MKLRLSHTRLARVASVLTLSLVALSTVPPVEGGEQDTQRAAQAAQYQQELRQIGNDRDGVAEKIVQRWEASARASGKWDHNWHADLHDALANLPPDNLLAADKAATF
jgi:hypothetical protein